MTTPRERGHETPVSRNKAWNGIMDKHLWILEAYLEETGPGHEEQRLYAATIHILCEPHSMALAMLRTHCTANILKRSLDDRAGGGVLPMQCSDEE